MNQTQVVRIFRRVYSLDFIIVLFAVWEVFSRFIYPKFEPQAALFLPPFSLVFKEFFQLISSGLMLEHIFASIKRIMIGFTLASAVGIFLGLFFGTSRLAYEQLRCVCGLFRAVPPVAWIPLSLLWFGITDAQQYFIIFIGVVFPVLSQTMEGVNRIPVHLRQMALTLGAKRLMIFKKVIMPAALPHIMFGLRSGMGYAWFIIVAAEFVSASNGLGYLILEGRNVIITERVFSGMIAIGMVNLFFYDVFLKLERLVIPWRGETG